MLREPIGTTTPYTCLRHCDLSDTVGFTPHLCLCMHAGLCVVGGMVERRFARASPRAGGDEVACVILSRWHVAERRVHRA
jgi:hypothetical protein